MAKRDRIDRPLTPPLDHRRNDLRMPREMALAEYCFGERLAALLGRHRLKRIRGGERVSLSANLSGSAGRGAAQDQRRNLSRMTERKLLGDHPAHRDSDNIRRGKA